MLTHLRVLAALALLGAGGGAHADTDCNDPIATWKPREQLQHDLEQRGWTVQRIKVDDGCYEVRGRDRRGNRVKAKYAPATLQMRSLEVEFESGGDASDYSGVAPPRPDRRDHAAPPIKGSNP